MFGPGQDRVHNDGGTVVHGVLVIPGGEPAPLLGEAEYTSWVLGQRVRSAGLLGSMGRVVSSVDNTMMESFWSTMQRELLDTRPWATPDQLASAIFEWTEM